VLELSHIDAGYAKVLMRADGLIPLDPKAGDEIA
jgi:hypothetical protein